MPELFSSGARGAFLSGPDGERIELHGPVVPQRVVGHEDVENGCAQSHDEMLFQRT